MSSYVSVCGWIPLSVLEASQHCLHDMRTPAVKPSTHTSHLMCLLACHYFKFEIYSTQDIPHPSHTCSLHLLLSGPLPHISHPRKTLKKYISSVSRLPGPLAQRTARCTCLVFSFRSRVSLCYPRSATLDWLVFLAFGRASLDYYEYTHKECHTQQRGI